MFATLYKPLSESESTWAKAKITDIFKIISYNYTKKFYEVGSFSMVIPVNEPSAGLLETNTFLATNEGDYLFVTGIKETENRITLEGYDLKYLLAGRVTLFPTEAQDVGAYGYYVTKGTTGECICDIVNHNIAEATDPNRRIYGFSVNSAPVGIANDTYMTRLEPLDQVVGTLCKNAGIGYDVEMRFDPVFGDSIAFLVINPTDRSENQTDVPKVIFSKRFLNVETLSREIGVDAEKNAIYAVNGTNIDDAIVKLVNRGGEDRANYGVYRRETTVNVNCDIDEIDSYALKETEDFVTADSFVMDVMAAESYKREWFVGDIVTFRHKGLSRDAPIIAAEIQRTADKFTVKLSAGETVSKPVSMINRKSDKTVNEITQKKFDDGYVTVVKELPEEGKKNKIYVLEEEQAAALADDPGGASGSSDTVSGFVFVDGQWKKIGGEGGGTVSGGVGEFTNEDKNSEIFNDYVNNYINSRTPYAHISGISNSIDKDDTITSFSNMAAIFSGVENAIKSSMVSLIMSSLNSSIINSGFAKIIGGMNNTIKQVNSGPSLANFILAGANNNIEKCSHAAMLLCERCNITANGSKVCFIFCEDCKVAENTPVYIYAMGGKRHEIKFGTDVFILGGAGNKIAGNQSYFFGSANEFLCQYGTQNLYVFGDGHKYNKQNAIIQKMFIIGECSDLSNYNTGPGTNYAFVIGNGSYSKPSNAFYITKDGDVYAKSFNIMGESAVSEASTFSAQSSDNPDLSELAAQISEIKADIEALRAENAALRTEIAALK